ncbi:MAG: SDR family oxidoreductase [Pseudomonadota bacterium]
MSETALITGASSGIGEALARVHAEKGGDLILIARRADKLNALKEELEGKHRIRAHVITEDLSDEDAPQRIFDAVAAAGLSVDMLINNAGFGGRGKFHERAWREDRDMMQVNIIALSALTHLFLPVMVDRGTGRILNVSSPAGELPGPLQAVYFASKAYVTSFSNALAEELHDTDITVTALLPGATASEFAATSDMEETPLFDNPASPRSIAKTGYRAMLRGALTVFAGVPFRRRIFYRLISLFPKRALLRQVRQIMETGQ